ncbi:2-isopropylmalate synthase [Diplodia corticola]|uniref:2-isopropylmalate synthase n=1 Tax=Diplodia corticola TaxID=236234 RepID=A0A1J9SIU4_9PEZI|nr:2-isopropylmalate synthase [Diplodia corticola]OJD40279.1 2-isopropylmalate synthase [Diplodia corticola]
MPMLKSPSAKYDTFRPIKLPDRQWPSQSITEAPTWLATDLRDGNQSLEHPMTINQKWKYFQMLVRIGFKEIDVSFPSASDTEFDFTRRIVETPNMALDDVWLQVLSPCKKEHIRRTVDSVTGAKKAILSLYIAASDNFLETIFGMSQQQVLEQAVECVAYARSITKDDPQQQHTRWKLMFSPEAFSDTDLTYSTRLCEAVKEAWGPTEEDPIILNLPATVEMASPNVFADQVELFCRSIPASERSKVVVSLHPHNDRGCAVAASELGIMAGARRVEGCLFGNGERTGNVDLVTLALNLYTQGIDPGIDLSDLKSIKAVFEECTQLRIPTRMPYSGDAVFIAYSGSHQDAISKAFNKMKKNGGSPRWKVPYLAIDPKDIGASYESVIRVNSQSGKGGVAWTLSRHLQIDIDLPKGLQLAFSKTAKSLSETLARTLSPSEISDLFLQTYHVLSKDPRICSAGVANAPAGKTVEAAVFINGKMHRLLGSGKDVLEAVENAFANGVGGGAMRFELHHRTLVAGNGAIRGIAIVECVAGTEKSSWGANISDKADERYLLACLGAALGMVSKPLVNQKVTDIIGRDLGLLNGLRRAKEMQMLTSSEA